ncbi:MAG: hypothetical protein PVF75_02270, partial [Granulosicoccaceae bacterium]
MASLYTQIINSLKGRYLFAAIMLSLLLVITALIAHHYVQTTSTASTANIKQRNRVLSTTESLRKMLWDANHAMHFFILQPGDAHYTTAASKLEDAIKQSEFLSGLEWIKQHDLVADSLKMQADFTALRQETLHLMQLRENIEELFPAMVLLRDVMTPLNKDFSTACNLAIDEIHTEANLVSDTRTYNNLIAIQNYWNRVISTFRGYVALLTGTFGKDNPDILQQEKNIEVLYKEVQLLLDELEQSPVENLGFQTHSSLQQ